MIRNLGVLTALLASSVFGFGCLGKKSNQKEADSSGNREQAGEVSGFHLDESTSPAPTLSESPSSSPSGYASSLSPDPSITPVLATASDSGPLVTSAAPLPDCTCKIGSQRWEWFQRNGRDCVRLFDCSGDLICQPKTVTRPLPSTIIPFPDSSGVSSPTITYIDTVIELEGMELPPRELCP